MTFIALVIAIASFIGAVIFLMIHATQKETGSDSKNALNGMYACIFTCAVSVLALILHHYGFLELVIN